jgi:hypothetical protein
VVSDNQVFNPLALRGAKFAENRFFFTEGTELFNRGDLFYSRRCSAQPNGFSGNRQLRRSAVGSDGKRQAGE